MSQKIRTLVLILNFILFGAVYWGLGNTRFTIGVTYVYYALTLILSVLYLLVAGGLRKPPLPKGKEREKRETKRDYHPVKRREKYKSFRIKEEKKEEKNEEGLGPNFLKLPEEKRPLICHILLTFIIPLYGIFLFDWFYLKFFI